MHQEIWGTTLDQIATFGQSVLVVLLTPESDDSPSQIPPSLPIGP